MPNVSNDWDQQWHKLVLEDCEAKAAYVRLTGPPNGERLRPHIDGALQLFALNETRREWALPREISRRRLHGIPGQLCEIAADLTRLSEHAFFCDLGGSTAAIPTIVQQLKVLADELAGRTELVLVNMRRNYKGSEFDFKLRSIVPHLVELARKHTGKPHFEDFADIFASVAILSAADIGVNAKGVREAIPESDLAVTAEKIRGMCRATSRSHHGKK